MTILSVKPTYPSAPTTTPRKGGLLDVMQIQESNTWLEPTDLFPSYNCLDTGTVPVFPCPDPGVIPDKTFSGLSWQDGIRFAGYAGTVCKAIGYDAAEGESETKRVYLANETVAVERAFMEQIFGTSGMGVDITPAGGAVAPEVGLALLEGAAAKAYAGVPTVHVPRAVASLLLTDRAIEFQGNALYSRLGSKVAGGGGYDLLNVGPDGSDPTAGEVWLYASGEAVLARGEIFARSEMNRSTNEMFTLVERTYIGAVDCYVAAVRVKVF
jgi:hypothetical protein